jgi:trigger factor
MGARVGETRSVEYRYPDAVIKEEITGKTVTLYATVKAVYRQTIPELIDAFVQQMGIGLDSVQALRESVRIDLLEEKELARVQAVWLAILEDVSVLSYPEKELSASMERCRLYYENLAELYGVEFEDLLKVYCKLDSESFEAQMRAAAEEKVKNDMIFTQLVRLQEISLSEEEYEEGAWRYFEKEEGEFSSFEEFEKSYTKEALWQNLLWDKALLSVAERAVPAKNQ